MTPRQSLCIVPIACALLSCTTASVHLYTLSTPPPSPLLTSTSTASLTAARQAHDVFVVESIRIPSAVDRKELVVRKSANELVLLENANWAAPLREEVWRALVADLRMALRDSAAGDSASPMPTIGLRVDIGVWEATAQTVYLHAEWRIRSRGAATPFELRCNSDLRESTSGSPGDLVRADQALLADLAKSIAPLLRTDQPTECGPTATALAAP